jgi:hypothetical protein
MAAPLLTEDRPRRTLARIAHEYYLGTVYHRFFVCPGGDSALHILSGGDLALGAVLPVKWGGVASGLAHDPRLMAPARIVEQRTGGNVLLEADFLALDVAAPAAPGYVETTRSRQRPQDGPYERRMQTVAVCLTDSDPLIPAPGHWLDPTRADPMGYVCASVFLLKDLHPGRIFVLAQWEKTVGVRDV